MQTNANDSPIVAQPHFWLSFALLLAVPSLAWSTDFDLRTDWSDGGLPMAAVWSIEFDGIALVPVPDVTVTGADNFLGGQAGYATVLNDLVPIWFQARDDAVNYFLNPPDADWLSGDIVFHDADAAPTSVTWTSPENGSADISVSLWNPRNFGRLQHFELTLNGVVLGTGDVDDSSDRANRVSVSASDVAISVGDVIAVTSTSVIIEDYMGIDFSIATTPDITDSDGDGIEDSIDGIFNGAFVDQSALVSDDFGDQHLAGTTHGTIVARGDNEITAIDDVTKGVILAANGGGGLSLVQMCGPFNIDIFNLSLTDGNEVVVTCGSLTAEVLSGPVSVTVGVNIDITIPAGAKAFMEQLPGSLVTISNISGTGGPDIIVDDDNGVTSLGPDDPPLVTMVDDGIPDVPDDVTGRAKPGKVSLRWTPVDGAESFDVYRGLQSGGPYGLVGSVGRNVFLDTDVVTGETYYYVVQSIAGANSSDSSNEVEVLVPAGRRSRR